MLDTPTHPERPLTLPVAVEIPGRIKARLILEGWVCALIDQVLDHRKRTHSCRHHQRGGSVHRLRINERMLLDELLHNLQLTTARRVVERRPPGTVDLCTTLQERIKGGLIAQQRHQHQGGFVRRVGRIDVGRIQRRKHPDRVKRLEPCSRNNGRTVFRMPGVRIGAAHQLRTKSVDVIGFEGAPEIRRLRIPNRHPKQIGEDQHERDQQSTQAGGATDDRNWHRR